MSKQERLKLKEVLYMSAPLSNFGIKNCNVDGCDSPQLGPIERCWNHLKDEEKTNFRKYLEEKRTELEGIKIVGADLSNLNLSGANLNKSFFIDVNFKKTVFEKAGLLKAILNKCTLDLADFTEAQCNWINLSECQAIRTIFRSCILTSCYAAYSTFNDCDFSKALLKNANFSHSSLESAIFNNSDLEDANFKFANLSNAKIRNANMQFLQLSMANLSNADISGSKVFGFSPWNIAAEGLLCNGIIRDIDENHLGLLPKFLQTSFDQKRYVFRIVTQDSYSSIVNLTNLLHHIDSVYSSSEIWGDKKIPKFHIVSIERGTLDIKFIVDLLENNIALINTSILSIALFFSFALKITREIFKIKKEFLENKEKELGFIV